MLSPDTSSVVSMVVLLRMSRRAEIPRIPMEVFSIWIFVSVVLTLSASVSMMAPLSPIGMLRSVSVVSVVLVLSASTIVAISGIPIANLSMVTFGLEPSMLDHCGAEMVGGSAGGILMCSLVKRCEISGLWGVSSI